MATTDGQEVASISSKSHCCAACKKIEQKGKPFSRRSACQLEWYYSKECQKQHCVEHKAFCLAV